MITSPIGKVYIGQSWKLERRQGSYRRLECKNQSHLYNSIIKYGWNNHVFKIIHYLPGDVDQTTLNTYEILYYQLYMDCGVSMLNMREPGANGKFLEESKRKMSKALMGNRNASGSRSDEFKANCSLNRKGKPGNFLDKKHTLETKDRISSSKKNKPAKNRKSIIDISTGKVYDSLTEAANDIGMLASCLSCRLNNKYKNKTTLRWHKQL